MNDNIKVNFFTSIRVGLNFSNLEPGIIDPRFLRRENRYFLVVFIQNDNVRGFVYEPVQTLKMGGCSSVLTVIGSLNRNRKATEMCLDIVT